MSVSAAVVPFITHFVPILFFVHLITDLMMRNPRSIEHRLSAGIALCCMLMFTEELVRHFLPIAYSSIITAAWFSTSGITITGLGMHLFIRLTNLQHRMPRPLYPCLFYLPTVLVLINLFVNDQMVSGNVFHQAGIWKLPVYNAAYYIAMIGSNVFNVIYIIILLRGKKNAESRELKEIFNELMAGVVVTAFFNLVIGTIDFRGWLPPYPYIYGTLIWCILLRRTMLRYDFLNHLDRRYEKLFNMNPLAILLFDLKGNLREANPVAIQLFASMALEPQQFFAELPEEMKARIASRHKIAPTERVILSEAGAFEVLIDCDYVVVEHIPHVIMIIRDVTQEKQNQREIAFLAYHDALTGLPNRRFYMEKLHEAIRRADRLRQPLAVAIFDVDHFKSINDKYGHLAGDQALVHIADKLREVIAPDGIVARLGGDEFSFFLADRPVEEVIEKIRQLLRALRQDPLSLPNANIPLCISIGVSLYPEHGQDSDTMLSNADKALYRVKRHTRNGYAVYSASDD